MGVMDRWHQFRYWITRRGYLTPDPEIDPCRSAFRDL